MADQTKVDTAPRTALDERLEALGDDDLEMIRGGQQPGATLDNSFDNSFDNSWNIESLRRDATRDPVAR